MSKMVHGTEILGYDGIKLTKKTRDILKQLKTKGFAKFEYDDSTEDYNTLQQITTISGNVGYDVWEKPHRIVVTV